MAIYYFLIILKFYNKQFYIYKFINNFYYFFQNMFINNIKIFKGYDELVKN